jgi:hypothetical protein
MSIHARGAINGALGRIVAGGLLGLALVSGGAASIAGLQAAPAKSGGKHTQILQGTAITGAVRSGEVNLATLPPATPAMLQASAAASARIPAPYRARQTVAQQDAYRQWALAHPGALPKASGGPAPTSADGANTYGNGVRPVLLSQGAGLTRSEAGMWLVEPDPALAAAPGYLFEGVNNVMEVYSTTYAKKYGPWTPDQLFASVKHTNDIFGFPQITYDAERSRYLIAWLEVGPVVSGNAEGYDYIDLAISNTSTPSPLTNFRVYQYAMTKTGADNVCWSPTLGYDYWGVYVTCETDSASSGTFTGNNTLAFSTNKMLSGTLQGVYYPTVYIDIGCPAACHPALRLSPTIEDGVPQAEWVTATDEGPDLIGTSHIGVTSQNQTVCAMTNTHALDSGGKPTYTCVNTTLPMPYAGPFPASQPGQTVYTDVGYKQVAYRNGQLYFAMTESVNCSGVTHDGIYWAAITPQLTTLAANNPQHVNGVVDADTQTGVFCFTDADAYMSALIADTEGDMALVFTYSGSGSTQYPSIGYTGRTAADLPGTMGQGTGSADVVKGSHASSNWAWGEFATCALPTNLVTRGVVYCSGQFGGTDTGSYGWDTELFAIRMQ